MDVASDRGDMLVCDVLVECLARDAGLFDGENHGVVTRRCRCAQEGVEDLYGARDVDPLVYCLSNEEEEVGQGKLDRGGADLIAGLGLLLVGDAHSSAAVGFLPLLACLVTRELGLGVALKLLMTLLVVGDEGVRLTGNLLAGLLGGGGCSWQGCFDRFFGLGQRRLHAGGGDCQGVVLRKRGRGHGRRCRAGGGCLRMACGHLWGGFCDGRQLLGIALPGCVPPGV